MIDLFTEVGAWWGNLLRAHPFETGLWFVGFVVGWVFQHATRLRYPDYDTRPEWARWVVFFADAVTTDVVNVVLKRWPARGPGVPAESGGTANLPKP